jgi:hypothetical protein
MTEKIERLTPEQEARFPEFVERWTKIGLSTEPADRPRAEAAVREMYARAGLAPPQKIVWCGSPLSLALTRSVIVDRNLLKKGVGVSVTTSVIYGIWDSVGESVDAYVSDSIWDSVTSGIGNHVGSIWDNVTTSIMDSLRESVDLWGDFLVPVGDGVWMSVKGSVSTSLERRLHDQIWAKVINDLQGPNSIGESVRNSDEDCVHGQHDAAYLACWRYLYEVLALTAQTEKLSGRWELAQSAGWAFPHANICWVAERHHILKRDERGRLHSLAGPACAYPDGWEIYAIHGVRVPASVVERPHEITLEKIDNETNAEIRRVLIDRYRVGEEINGAAAFMRDAGGERIDHDEKFGTLWRREVVDDEPIVLLEVTNATPEPGGRFKHYWLRVPPTMTSAREAAAWTFDLGPEDYAPLIET